MTSSTSSVAVTGQAKIAVTGTAVKLPGFSLHQGVIISAPSSNAANILIGGSTVDRTADGTGTGYVLVPGGSISATISSVSALYINGAAGDWVSFIGS